MTGAYLTRAKLEQLRGQLSVRDREVLAYLGELRFLSSSQLARLCFAGVDARTARRALGRLTRLGVAERLPQRIGGRGGGSAASLYRLGLAGQRLAVALGFLPGPARRRPEIPGTAFMRHALAVSELHTLLIEADRAGRLELLARETEPACWRPFGGRGVLKPDSYLRLGAGEFEDSYFVEVDLGTEGSRALMAKLRDYLAYAASGREQARHGVFPRVLWLTPDENRATAIRGCVRRLRPDERELFTVCRFADGLSVMGQ